MTEQIFRTILKRLDSYPGAHENETWKLDKDLRHCTKREQEEIVKQGLTIEMLTDAGLNRGQVAHILFGYRHTGKRG